MAAAAAILFIGCGNDTTETSTSATERTEARPVAGDAAAIDLCGRASYAAPELIAAFSSRVGDLRRWNESTGSANPARELEVLGQRPDSDVVSICYVEGDFQISQPPGANLELNRGMIVVDASGAEIGGVVNTRDRLPIERPPTAGSTPSHATAA